VKRRGLLRRLFDRGTTAAGTVFVVGLFLLAGSSALMTGAVHYTAQPPFCNSCHIMEPYYKSWQESKHADVACIECHYEPGSLETLEGKFKALSQLAKYVTRTQGTKPWAEVSDQSCMRSGCHSVPSLEGEVAFGRIRFDHRHHLLESRRGRRLRCVSCHSQIVQGEHVSVTSSVCITCHFMPDENGHVPEKSSDCLTCHGPPTEPVMVAGRAFVHDDYVERGVDCRECHDPVIEGNGTVRKERCHSCHAELGHIERIGETAFLHEKHVTEHKVECFECHDEIHHGLLPLPSPSSPTGDGCGVCHESPHDAANRVYAGTGAAGVPDRPSRMHETRVVCEACHTGRSGHPATHGVALLGDALVGAHGAAGPPHGAAAAANAISRVAAAGNVDCLHCHGPSYDGLLAEWQATVGGELQRLDPLVSELETRLAADPEAPADAEARKAVDEARQGLDLLTLDGSRGAHNVGYAVGVLRAAAERVDAARARLGVEGAPPAVEELPFVSAAGCSECHVGAGRPASTWKAEAVFPHRSHLDQGLDCGTCHSTTEHGKPAFPRDQCASCHHQESETRDVTDCASCHATQSQMLAGAIPGFAEKPGTMASMDCSECHGEAPDVVRPQPSLCVLCHEPGYDAMALEWRGTLDSLAAEVERALAPRAGEAPEGDARARAAEALALVRGDGSGGAHNFELAKSMLEEALALLGAR
jgi:nitrate/TMAO reductase-like tetraheme cytochrome c subunit